jgi:ATP-dependent RNA helicase DDX23/PRP28
LFSVSKSAVITSPKAPKNEKKRPEIDEVDEFTLMKAKYFGEEKEKRKIRKMNDKKFVFDWDAEEDTSMDINPIYRNKQPVVGLMARSRVAGYEAINKESNEKHWSMKKLENMTERDWRIFKEDYSISVKGTNVPHPLRNWKESTIPSPILKVIDQIGYRDPTPIQRQAIPIAIQGRDIIGVAETGSGKTASFVIPMLCFIKDLPPLDHGNSHLGPYALVLAPTRELALQIESEASKFAKAMNFICVSIVGGHSVESQTTNLLRGAHIIIATPGRLRDLIDRRILALAQCVYVVMDEADRMVDLGFEPDLKYILASMPATNLKPDNDQAEDSHWLNNQIQAKNPFRQTVWIS